MKKKWITVMLCITLGTFGLSGCGSAETAQTGEVEMEADSAQADAGETVVEETDLEQQAKNPDAAEMEDAIYGEVSEIGDDTITLATGTLNLPEPSEDDDEDFSLIELDGDETVIQLTDSTAYKQQSMGKGAPGGDAPRMEDGEEPPERPDGDGAPADGQEPPQKPDGDGKGAPADGQEPPQRPDGDEAPADGEAPQRPDGDEKGAPGNGGEAPQMGGNLTEITLEDISEGDIVSVILDEDGNAAEIIVMSAAD